MNRASTPSAPRGVVGKVGSEPAQAEAPIAATRRTSLTAEEKALDLRSARFASIDRLQRAFDNDPAMHFGEQGEGVAALQQALVDVGFPLPITTDNGTKAPDGIFGSETFGAVKAFQAQRGLTVDGVPGRQTLGALDNLFAGGAAPTPGPTPPSPTPPGPRPPAPQPPGPRPPRPAPPRPAPQTCTNGTVSPAKDPLPPQSAFQPQLVDASTMLSRTNAINKSLGLPPVTIPPLGLTTPQTPGFGGLPSVPPVQASSRQIGPQCFECDATFNLPRPNITVLVANRGFFVEPQLRGFIELDPTSPGSSGCRTGPFFRALQVRRSVLPEAVPQIVAGEREHFLDFQRAFDLTGARLLANVARLAPGRSHLRATSPAQCAGKVDSFLALADGLPAGLSQYPVDFEVDFAKTSSQSKARDDSGAHSAVTQPPQNRKPIAPNIDVTKNPFGCQAFARFFKKDLLPGVPGPPSTTVIRDLGATLKQPWHVL